MFCSCASPSPHYFLTLPLNLLWKKNHSIHYLPYNKQSVANDRSSQLAGQRPHTFPLYVGHITDLTEYVYIFISCIQQHRVKSSLRYSSKVMIQPKFMLSLQFLRDSHTRVNQEYDKGFRIKESNTEITDKHICLKINTV